MSPEDGELLGIVSRTDVIRRLVEDPQLYAKEVLIWQLMTPDVVWVSVDDDIENVARRMLAERVHRVLVYDDRELTGIVTSFDFVEAAARRADARDRGRQPCLRRDLTSLVDSDEPKPLLFLGPYDPIPAVIPTVQDR